MSESRSDSSQLPAEPKNSTSPTTNSLDDSSSSTGKEQPRRRRSLILSILSRLHYVPPWCRYNVEKPPVFNIWTNILFAFAGAFTVANLYYNQPIENVLAEYFHVSFEEASRIPLLAQVGYAVGLLFITPLGDLVKRRPLTLGCIFCSATIWIGLCITKSFVVFEALTFVTGILTVTPQIMLPLVGDLVAPHKRATALSIVASGNVLGILIARILAGIVANYTNWRNIYWIAFALQCTILILLFLFMPDYPATSKHLNYFRMLYDVFRMLFTYPVLFQASLVAYFSSAMFTNYWTTLTFLLADPPYYYNSLVIGLFALIGLAGMCSGPIFARTIIDKYVPLLSALLGQSIALIGAIVGTYIGTFTVAGPVLFAFLLDVAFMITQVANRSAIYSCEPKARARVNTAFMVAAFLGQITGTSAGNRLYAMGGWYASGSLSVAFAGASLIVLLARGPWEDGWIGWKGGASIHKKDKLTADGRTSEQPHLMDLKQRALQKGGQNLTEEEKAAVRQLDGPSAEMLDVEKQHSRQETNTDKALEELAAEDGMNPVRKQNEDLEAQKNA